MAQANPQRLADGPQILRDEIPLILNMPGQAALQQQINTIREEMNANHQQVTALLTQGLAQLGEQIRLVQNEQQLLPMRLYNFSTSKLAPLRYPAAIPNDQLLPATRRDLSAFTANQLQAASQTLRLPELPANTLVEDRRRQIADYIGVPY